MSDPLSHAAQNSSALKGLADRLWSARIENTPCPPVTELLPGISLEQAYGISRLCFDRRLAGGERAVGRKIGLTSRAVQAQLGVHEPDFGFLTDRMQIADGAVVPAGSLIQARAEGEVVWALARDLEGDVTAAQVIEATDYVVACIEIVDSRVQDWKIKIQDTVADNASSALFVLGRERHRPAEIDLRMAGMKLTRNGEVESTGVGVACLDHPANAVAWLARKMTELDTPLKAGDLILSGAFGPVVPFKPGDAIEVEISGLGKVSCSYGQA